MTYEYKIYNSEEELEDSLKPPFDINVVNKIFKDIYFPAIAESLNKKNPLMRLIKDESPRLWR